MLYPFSALLARMKYITRWSLMHSTRAESLSEHTCDTALLAHMLCLIARRYTGTPCRPKTVAVAALYHDAPEIITGDMPTPVKYSSPTLRDAYKALETESVRCMTGLLPDELSEELSPFISGELLTAEEKRSWIETQSGVTCGSDAFFPFGDNVERARKSGVQYIAQPGGSVRDGDVIACCDDFGMAMAMTGIRLFHH